MRSLVHGLGVLVILSALAACQITGAAAPSGQYRDGMTQLGAPGSGAP
ncbi:MAG: hypothetical protein INR65_17100 [Gluconacetobacter diazotrophicus]|nr:hypothetical protein [Gluconacetobacter diazotrophicus]